MKQEELVALSIRGMIASMPEELKAQVSDAYTKMKALLEEHGDAGKIALSLAAAEFGAEE